MSKAKETWGSALNNSKFCVTVAFWLQQNPRLTAGKIRNRLISRYGKDAEFSEPHIQAWMRNFYPIIVTEAMESAKSGKGVGLALVNLTESALFGKVADTLDYYLQMVQLLENRMKEAETEYKVVYEKITLPGVDVAEIPKLSDTARKLRDQIMKFSTAIAGHRRYMDEWTRIHDFGERIGDAITQVVEASMDIILPEVPDDKRKGVVEEFKEEIKKIAHDLKVPVEQIYA